MPARPASAPCARAPDSGAGTAGGERTVQRSRQVSAAAAEAKTPPRVRLPRRCGRGARRRRGGGTGARARVGLPRQAAGRARASVWWEDPWAPVPGPRREPGVLIPRWSPTYSASFPWPLASPRACTSRCGVLRCHPWDPNPAPPINSCVTPRFNYLTSQSLSFLICKVGT